MYRKRLSEYMNLFLYLLQETNVFQTSWKVENKRNTKRQKANENIESNINHRQKLRQTVLSKTNKTASQRSKVNRTSTLEKDMDLNNTRTFTLYTQWSLCIHFKHQTWYIYPLIYWLATSRN